MASKKDSATASSSPPLKPMPKGSLFISGNRANEFAAAFDNLVTRFSGALAQFSLCKDCISFSNNACVLGPRYLYRKADQLCNYELYTARAQIHVCRDNVNWKNWNKTLPWFFPKIDATSVELRWSDWVKSMEPKHKTTWVNNGIYHVIKCSTTQLQTDSPLLSLTLMFWNSASNTFDFGVGPISISPLDLAVVFGSRPHGTSADCLRDFEDGSMEEKKRKKRIEVLTDIIGSNWAYGAFMESFMNKELAKALAVYNDVATGPLILASLYRRLRDAIVEPINLNVKRPLWMVQVWFQWSFPGLRREKLQVADGRVPLKQLVSSSISGKTTEECFAFFMGRKVRQVSEWKMSVNKKCPWFKNHLIYHGPKDTGRPMASKNMEVFSFLQSRDLLGGRKMDTRNYQYGVEAYNPQFFSRQLGCPQVIPKLNHSLANKGSSYRFPKLSKEELMGIRAKYAQSAQVLELKSYQPDYRCTDAFQSWCDQCQARIGPMEAAYERAFKNCPFHQNLGKEEKQNLLAQLAEDNRFPFFVASNHKVFQPVNKLVAEKTKVIGREEGSAGQKAPIFVQRRRKLGSCLSTICGAFY